MKFDGVTDAYRIGWWTHHWWPSWWQIRGVVFGRMPDGGRYSRDDCVELARGAIRDTRLIRRPHRPWQAESPEVCGSARRGFTADGARQKMDRDVLTFLRSGTHSRWQLRRLAREWEIATTADGEQTLVWRDRGER